VVAGEHGAAGAQEREVDLDVDAADVLFSTGELPALDGRTVTLPAESAAVVSTR
jgi:maltooligosyltrehalose trehalohydrolase